MEVFLKNPPGHNAWKLIKSSIDESFYQGPVKLSKKHSNFLKMILILIQMK